MDDDSNIVKLDNDAVSDGKPYAREQELHDRIVGLIYEYGGQFSVVAVVGILDMVKDEIKSDAGGGNA